MSSTYDAFFHSNVMMAAQQINKMKKPTARHILCYMLFYYGILCVFAVPPDILDYSTSTDMVVREGSDVTLKCAAVGSPTPAITWRREGGEPVTMDGNGGKHFIFLTIL